MSKPRTKVPGATPWRGYSTPSPTDGSPTFWWVDDTLAMRPWPAGTRYAPMLPAYDSASKQERREDLGDFYGTTYFPFLERVASAIAADFDGAAARFTATFGVVEFPRSRAAVNRSFVAVDRQRRKYEAIVAASRVRHGASIAQAARHLGLIWSTARTRIAAGEQLLQADPDGSRQFVADYVHQRLEDGPADQLVAALLDGSRFDAFRVAARLIEAEAKPQPPRQDWAARVAEALERTTGAGPQS